MKGGCCHAGWLLYDLGNAIWAHNDDFLAFAGKPVNANASISMNDSRRFCLVVS